MTAPLVTRQGALPLRSGEWIWFYAIQLQLAATVAALSQVGANQWVCLTSRNQSTSFAGVTWYPWPIMHDRVEADAEGNMSEVSLKLGNFNDLPAEQLRERNGLEGMRVLIILSKASLIASPQYAAVEGYDIAGSEVQDDANAVILRLGQPRLHTVQMPPARWLRNGCRFRFKGSACGYVEHYDDFLGQLISHETCDLTLDGNDGCAQKKNTERYGGAPNLPEFL